MPLRCKKILEGYAASAVGAQEAPLAGEESLRLTWDVSSSWLVWLLAVGVYGSLTSLSLALSDPSSLRAPLWPAAGVALASLLLSQRKGPFVLGFLFTAGVGWLLHGQDLLASAVYALVGTAEVWLSALLIEKVLGRRPRLSLVSDTLSLCVLPAFLIFPGSTLLLHRLAAGPGPMVWEAWAKDWAATVVGMLLVCPLILAWVEERKAQSTAAHRVSWPYFSEQVGLFSLLLTVSVLVFSRPSSHFAADLPYLIYPFWFLLAMRGSQTACGLASLLVTLLAAWFTSNGLGPFVPRLASSHDLGLLSLLAFLGVGTLAALGFGALTREKSLAERALSESQNLFENLIDNIPAFISVKSLSGRYLLANRLKRELFAAHGTPVVGKTDYELYGKVDATRLRERDLEVLRTGQAVQFEESRQYQGRTQNLLSVHFPLYQTPGSSVVICRVSTDITHLKEMEAERISLLKREKAARQKTEALFHEAQRLNRLKDEFLMTLSHELRVPLHGILGWTRILATAQSSEEERQVAFMNLKRSVEAESRVIDELLDISRILTKKIKVKLELIDADEIVNSALKAVKRASREKSIAVKSESDGEAHLVHADARRLEQVLINVLVNAIKFTPREGQVSVQVSREEQQVAIVVSDTGIGIEAEEMPHIFKRFWQADSSLSRSYGGLGLGLALVQELVTLHGGSIKAESRGLGQGASFTLLFPAAVWEGSPSYVPLDNAAAAVVGSEDEEPEHLVDLSQLSLLAIDDDESTCMLIAAVLSGEFRELRTATSAQEAMDILAYWQPDFILCDIAMPGEDGISFIRRARELARRQGWDLHAAALSANADESSVRSALQEGFHAYLTKPVDPVRIIEVIRLLLSDARPQLPYFARQEGRGQSVSFSSYKM